MRNDAVEWGNVQGLVLSGFGRLRCAAYVLFKFVDPEPNRLSREWLWRLTQRLVNAEQAPRKHSGTWSGAGPIYAHNLAAYDAMCRLEGTRPEVWAVNLALTPSGLTALGATPQELGLFSDAFQKGMAPELEKEKEKGEQPRRSNLLGDVGASSPESWLWGGRGENQDFDGVLLLYADDQTSLGRLVASEQSSMRGIATPLPCPLQSIGPEKPPQACNRERTRDHFGFLDGFSQPIVAGSRQAAKLSAREKQLHVVAPGEFVLGYPDTRGATVSYATSKDTNVRDLARNGTYVVVRQLEQNVAVFQGFLAAAARAVHGCSTADTQGMIAAKLLGRTTEGAPLLSTVEPARPCAKPRNDFLYKADDAAGLACPLGAHIRRANPRDIAGPDPETALKLSAMHRLMRRGRPYGLYRREASEETAAEGRGLFFICLNASIANQFELVQHSWINNPAFDGLDGEIDPLSHAGGGTFTIQARGGNVRLQRPEPFVTVRGGAYFFMPGLNALRQLCA